MGKKSKSRYKSREPKILEELTSDINGKDDSEIPDSDYVQYYQN